MENKEIRRYAKATKFTETFGPPKSSVVGTLAERERGGVREEINGIVFGDRALGMPSFSLARDKSRGQGSNACSPLKYVSHSTHSNITKLRNFAGQLRFLVTIKFRSPAALGMIAEYFERESRK